MAEPTTVAIVPHTHWDREWHETFQRTRARLVPLVDTVLALLERDPSYRRFLLDGQTMVIDDYLEVRPDAEDRIRGLVANGRLQVGPWMVLADEFMVSGETIVRTLQLGLARAAELGGAMTVGYLPDMFGHVAQMPQILRLAGFEHAVVWRGVPRAIDRSAFWWEAPDGSRVRAEYLYGSYANGRDLPDDAKALVARAADYEAEIGAARLPGSGLLIMNGGDRRAPQPFLGRTVAEANAAQRGYRFEITSLPEHLATQPVEGLPAWRGELRSGARAPVLMGVASNRVDVHQACAAAERALERGAEPLAALFLPAATYPSSLLDIGWRSLVLNAAHDSACACSHDDVVDAVLVRYREARDVAEAVVDDALAALATQVAAPGAVVIVNPTRAERSGVVTMVMEGDGPWHLVDHPPGADGTRGPVQTLRPVHATGFAATVIGEKVRWVLELMRGTHFAGRPTASVQRREVGPDTWEYGFEAAAPGAPGMDLEDVRDEVAALGASGATIRFRQHLPPAHEVAFAPGPVPGFGWRAVTLVPGALDEPADAGAARAQGHGVDNAHLRVRVDPVDATLTIETADGVVVTGAHRLVDGGDGGDTYSYSPPTLDLAVDRPEHVEVRVVEVGPVRAALEITSTYRWPAGAVGDEHACERRRDDTVDQVVHTRIELRTGERFVRVRTELDHRVRDHRLRAHLPLPAPVTGSDAECAFAVVHRGLVAEGGPQEAGLATFVSRRFVDCSDGDLGVAVLHDGLLEYEVLDDGRKLALTLLRATGYLSRAEPALRPEPAGPATPLEGPQLQGRVAMDYAILPHRGDWRAAALHAGADDFLVPLRHRFADPGRGAPRDPLGRALRVEGAEVAALRRDGGALVVRVFNPGPDPTEVTIEHEGVPARGWITDLRGNALDPFEGAVHLGPAQIATLRLVEGPAGPSR